MRIRGKEREDEAEGEMERSGAGGRVVFAHSFRASFKQPSSEREQREEATLDSSDPRDFVFSHLVNKIRWRRSCLCVPSSHYYTPSACSPVLKQRRAVRTFATEIASTSAAPRRPRLEALRAQAAQIDDFLGPDPPVKEKVVFTKNNAFVPSSLLFPSRFLS